MLIKRLTIFFIFKIPGILYAWSIYVLGEDYKVGYGNYLYRILGEITILHNSRNSPAIFVCNGLYLNGGLTGHTPQAYSARFLNRRGGYAYKYLIQAEYEGNDYFLVANCIKSQNFLLQTLKTKYQIIENSTVLSRMGKLTYFLPTSRGIMEQAVNIKSYHMPSLITIQQYYTLTKTVERAIQYNMSIPIT